MPGKRVKANLNGEWVDAEEVHVNSMNEHLNTYLLDDGSTVTMRAVVISIVRAIDRYDPEGNPVYVVKSQNVLSVSAPDRLRKSPG